MAGVEEVCRRAAITPRQVDHWTRRGWLRPVNAGCGSGYVRDWPESEVQVAITMGRLVRAGVSAEAAHRVALGGRLGPGIILRL